MTASGLKKVAQCTFPFHQCCGSGMFITDPRSRFFSIPDLGSRIPELTKTIGEKKLNKLSNPFLAYLIFEQVLYKCRKRFELIDKEY
jgi:hypothetical protein